jgi:hypothetical protein
MSAAGQTEGRENRPRSRHCDRQAARARVPRVRNVPEPEMPALFARKGEAMGLAISREAFLFGEIVFWGRPDAQA